MALLTEDGSGIIGAESYCSVAAADAYLKARGITAWADQETADKEIYLRQATDYMTQAYRGRWTGIRTKLAQSLDWPRFGAPLPDMSGYGYGYVPSTIIPAEVLGACALLAAKAIAGPLAPDIERATIREKVGPLEVQYDQYAPVVTQYRAIDAMLRTYLTQTGAMTRLVRS